MDNPFFVRDHALTIHEFSVYFKEIRNILISLDNELSGTSDSDDIDYFPYMLSSETRRSLIHTLEAALVSDGGLRWYVTTVTNCFPEVCALSSFQQYQISLPKCTLTENAMSSIKDKGLDVLRDMELGLFFFDASAVCTLQVGIWCHPTQYWLDKHQQIKNRPFEELWERDNTHSTVKCTTA